MKRMSETEKLAKQKESEIVDAAWKKFKEETSKADKLSFWDAAECFQNARFKFFGEFFRAHRVYEETRLKLN
jgi:hypothetical protein